jgi:hypothetical protein
MTAASLNPTMFGIAAEFVKSGIEKAGIPLTETLEAYLSITFARFIRSEIHVDLLTLRITKALDARAPRDEIRGLADECLIATALFGRRLRRAGAIRHYVAMGQMTYDAANMTEQAYGFVHMRDVIASAAARDEAEDPRVLFDQARAGSQTARAELAGQNVVVGPWAKPAGHGLLWR